MRKTFLGVAALVAAAAVATAQMGPDLLKSFTTALKKADGLSVSYSLTTVGKTPEKYAVTLAKPNQARLDTPTKLIVADGTNISVLLKKDKVFYKKTQTEAALKALFNEEGVTIWSPFFNEKAYAKVAQARNEGVRTRKGVDLKVLTVALDTRGDEMMTLYLHPKDNVLRQAQFVSKSGLGETTVVLNTESLTLGKPTGSDLFAFSAPAGSKQVTEEELMASKWLNDFEEAKKIAKATGKGIMVDFYTDWCHYCKQLDSDVFSAKEFKEAAKDFVLVKINAEEQTQIASYYRVTGYRCIVFMNKEGVEVHRVGGYLPLQPFLAQMAEAKAKL